MTSLGSQLVDGQAPKEGSDDNMTVLAGSAREEVEQEQLEQAGRAGGQGHPTVEAPVVTSASRAVEEHISQVCDN